MSNETAELTARLVAAQKSADTAWGENARLRYLLARLAPELQATALTLGETVELRLAYLLGVVGQREAYEYLNGADSPYRLRRS